MFTEQGDVAAFGEHQELVCAMIYVKIHLKHFSGITLSTGRGRTRLAPRELASSAQGHPSSWDHRLLADKALPSSDPK